MPGVPRAGRDRFGARMGALMAFEAATLAVASYLHLAGHVHGFSKPFQPDDAGIAEALICVVLLCGAAALVRAPDRGRGIAVGATCFAILGFLVGLNFTLRGGDAADLAYHATMLPVLVVGLVVLLRHGTRDRARSPSGR